MAKVQVTESAAQQAVKASRAEHTITDDKGRVLVLRKPGVLAQFNIVKAVGSESAKNESYMAMVMPLIYLKSIDGALVSPPTNPLQLDALITKLDEEGVLAVMKCVQDNYGNVDPDAAKAELKNE